MRNASNHNRIFPKDQTEKERKIEENKYTHKNLTMTITTNKRML